ncbi:portal protein [Pseudorhodoferax sp.]|uniref:portal protein n=1 Tax=Pseudorhodoferax sp. TaxID=1993553 RepID=UPI0039E604F2
MAVDPKRLQRRHSAMQADKLLHASVWKNCFDLSMPVRGDGLLTNALGASDVQAHKARIFDSTAGESVKVGAATVAGGLVPANTRWFDLDVGQETEDETRFLEDMADFLWENIHAANFDAESFDGLLDSLIAGWFVLYQDEAEEGGFYFECWPLGQCTIASSRNGALIDTVYREWDATVGQVVAEYGLDAVSAQVRRKYEDGEIDVKIRLLHAIEPREVGDSGARLARNMRWASVHKECATDTILRESGYHEFPCMVPRWTRLPNSPYATGPMSDALPTVQSLNELTRWTLMGAETTVAPPIVVANDGVVNARNLKIGPRKIIPASSVDDVKPLVTGADIKAGALTVTGMQASIRKILMADQLPPVEGTTKTAYEWSVRVQMLRQMMGPMFDRFQSEFLQPLIERSFGIAWRANIASGFRLVGRPPESLLNRTFSVRYLSPLARAQKLEDVNAMDRFEDRLVATAANKQDPTLLDVYDFEGGQRMRALMLGVPQTLVRDARAIQKIRQAREVQQQEQAQQALAMQGQAEMQSAAAQNLARAAA